MKKVLFLILLTAFCLSGCLAARNPNHLTLQPNEYIYWVNSSKVDCTGVGPMRCLQVQKGDDLASDSWEFFYSNISGFKYEPGYLYKIIVKEESIPSNERVADGSSIKHTLIKVLDKRSDN